MSRSENISTAKIKNAIVDVLQLPDLGDGVGDQTLGVDENGVAKVVTGGGGGAWGGITGTLGDQTDLQSALDGKEDESNKSTDVALGSSNTLYPTQNAVKTYADTLVAGLLDYRGTYDASGNTFPATGGSGAAGAIMKADTWYISVAGTLGGVAVIAGDAIIAKVDTPGQTAGNWNILNVGLGFVPENVANKSTDTNLGTSNSLYPSQNAVKEYVDAHAGGGTSTEVVALTDPQINVSSIGETYTDVAGNTYGETASQTRITMPANKRNVMMKVSGHVNAGTGTFALYNVTDDVVLGTPKTTTSVTEVTLSADASTLDTNNGDLVTLKVKNSGAGNTVTIDSGGMMQCEAYIILSTVSITAFGLASRPTDSTLWKLVALKGLSTATVTAREILQVTDSLSVNSSLNVTSAGFTEADANTVLTRTPLYKIRNDFSTSLLKLNTTVCTGAWVIGISFQQSVEDL